MKLRLLSCVIVALAFGASAIADDLLGGGKGNGGGGGGTSTGGGKGSGGGSGGGSNGGGKGSGGTGKGSGGGGSVGGDRGPVTPPRTDRGPSNQGPKNNSPTVVTSRRETRSGQNTQSGINNRTRDAKAPIVVESYGIPRANQNGSIRDQARNEDRAYANHYRDSYYQYNHGWRDRDFWYPHYCFSYAQNTVVSPWYYYSNLPGYISVNRIQWWDNSIIVNGWLQIRLDDRYRNDRYEWDDRDYRDDRYRWDDRDDRGDYRQTGEVYRAIGDLERAFLYGDVRSIGEMIPRRQWVYIHNRDYRGYRIRSEDYYDLMADLVLHTRTRDFRVTRAETSGRYLRLTTQHVYSDAWNRTQNVYMRFTLTQSRNGRYEISEFETNNRRL